MIKRTYFMTAEKHWDEGSGHSFDAVMFSFRSWLPDQVKAFNTMKERIEELMESTPQGTLKVTSFNRC